MMVRMNRCLMEMQPVWEAEEILKHFCGNKSIKKSFKNTRNGPKMRKERHLEDFTPGSWVDEFNNLPIGLRSKIGQSDFDKYVRIFYKSRCHHQETRTEQCKDCGFNTKNYKDHGTSNVSNFKMKNLRRQRWEDSQINGDIFELNENRVFEFKENRVFDFTENLIFNFTETEF